jgi:hypothetical protein
LVVEQLLHARQRHMVRLEPGRNLLAVGLNRATQQQKLGQGSGSHFSKKQGTPASQALAGT